jgi:catechol 2,3-dioxygenase-like lactoylglutathione lyase family enzyme
MRADDQFHVGIVVDDLDAALIEMTDLFGYEWCSLISVETTVVLPSGETSLGLTFAYSTNIPRVEVIQSIPGTLWIPAPESGLHHLGFWSDDVAADADRLRFQDYQSEASGVRPDGEPMWAYHRRPGGPRIELVSRQLQAGLEQYWAST